MNRRISPRQIAQLLIVLTSACAMKWFYATASVDELRWILWPTTKLVEFMTGARFAFESRAGYMNGEHTFVIAAACAGVNFLITAFVMIGLRKLWRERIQTTSWRFISITAVIAYGATIITNAVRISLALQMLKERQPTGWLSPGELHRIEGILVYFGSLLLLFVLTEEFDSKAWRPNTSLLHYLFPLGVYYGSTLIVPLLNGTVRRTDFWRHAAVVLIVPLILVGPFCLIRVVLSRTSDHESRLRTVAQRITATRAPVCVPSGALGEVPITQPATHLRRWRRCSIRRDVTCASRE